MKIFIQNPIVRDKIYRAYIFINGKAFVGSSLDSYKDAVDNIGIADKIPEGMEGKIVEYEN